MRRIYDMETQPGLGPFSVSEAGLGWYRPRPVVRDTLTLVAGEDAWDFSLAYALRRARTLAFWVPESAFGSGGERNLAHRALARLAERAGVPMVVTSVTDDAAASTLARALEPHRRSAVIQTASWRESLPQRSNRLLVRNRLGRPEAMFLDEGATPHLRTPIPDLSDDPANLRWMVDVEVRDWAPARHRSIVPRLLNASSPGDARVTKEGLAYEGLSSMILSGVPLEQLTVHPVLSPAPLLDQLQHVASLSQWTCEVSEKGQFALATANLLGGFAELCSTLRDPDVAEILRAYVAGKGTAPGLALTDRRRYLSLDDFRALDLTVPADGRLETLRAQRLLQAGLVLKCGRCRHADWYRPRDADPTFECTRCATSQVPDREAWMGDPEPKWRYRLDEAVFQFVRHRGDLPALAAFERFEGSHGAVQFVPELTFSDPSGQEREVDFAVTVGSSLWLGEAFTDARYARSRKEEVKRLRRLGEVAAVLNARGIILATSATEIAADTAQRAQAEFPGPWPELQLRARVRCLPRPDRLVDEP